MTPEWVPQPRAALFLTDPKQKLAEEAEQAEEASSACETKRKMLNAECLMTQQEEVKREIRHILPLAVKENLLGEQVFRNRIGKLDCE